MRVAFLMLTLCGCHKDERIEAEREPAHEAAAAAPAMSLVPLASASAQPAAASASAPAPPPPAPPRIPCGSTTCGATQYCVRHSRGQGIAPPPGQNPVQSTSFECSNSLPARQTGGSACTAPGKDRQVSCVDLIPSMHRRDLP
jgi:hypothetical protein